MCVWRCISTHTHQFLRDVLKYTIEGDKTIQYGPDANNTTRFRRDFLFIIYLFYFLKKPQNLQ